MSSSRSVLSKIPPLKDTDMSDVDNILNQTGRDINIDLMFDNLMELLYKNTSNYSIEYTLGEFFNARRVVFWHYLEKDELFFSPTYSFSIRADLGIISSCFYEKCPTIIPCISKFSSYNEEVDGKISEPSDSAMIIPIGPRHGPATAIVQVIKEQQDSFFDSDYPIALQIYKKFRTYYSYIVTDNPITVNALNLITVSSLADVLERVSKQLRDFYNAKSIEFWLHRKRSNSIVKIEIVKGQAIQAEQPNPGIAGQCILKNAIVNERYMRNNHSFYPKVDGNPNDSCICVPYQISENRMWCVCLRGRTSPPHYSHIDEQTLSTLAPFAVKSLSSALMPPSTMPQFDDFEVRLKALLEVAEKLSGVLEIEELIPMIMERACRLLSAERCSLFLVDKIKHELVTSFAGGLDQALRLPMNHGIVGATALTGKSINVKDAYQDPRFDRTTDAATGFRTHAILSVPIFNNRGEITGVTEMFNKTGGRQFDEDDERMMNAFNVFCGISLDNAKLYKASLDLSKQLRSFTELSSTIERTDSVETSIKHILESAKDAVSATTATIYTYNQDEGNLVPIALVGPASEYGQTFAMDIVQERKLKIYDHLDIVRMTQGNEISDAIEKILEKDDDLDLSSDSSVSSTYEPVRRSRVSVVLSSRDVPEKQESKVEAVVGIPLMNSELAIIGVMEFICEWKIVPEDVGLLESFSVYASLIIERQMLKGIAEFGQDEVEMKRWMTDEERTMVGTIPDKFRLTQAQIDNIFSIAFDSPKWDGIGHFKVIFNIFEYFDFFRLYNITNEKLFRFLYAAKATYKKVPYHNWRHAVDVTQFISYEIKISGLEKVFTKFELFAIIVAAICHDANHDGFTNVFNVKAETPLGILYKNQSVMETHHCAIAISLLTRPELNLLESLNSEEYIRIWNLIIMFILATDMARHFEILKSFNDIYDGGEFTMQRAEHRVMLLQMVLKCGDISNVSRPFELADRWCDVLCEEFFRQGDLEMANGMEYTSDLNDREHLDKPKSQIGFYTFITLPMFQAAGKAVPSLDINTRQVLSNLEVWKAQNEANKKLEEQAAAAAAAANGQKEAEEAKAEEVKEA